MADGGAAKRTRAFSFSSETPVLRWFGYEILDHDPDSVRMGFMKSGRAPLLMGHDSRLVIGVIERASLDKDKVGRGVARFGRGAMAEEALRDVDDGILSNTSAGYRVHEMRFDSSKNGIDTYRMTDWEPLEASLVGVPADPEVGIGRGIETRSEVVPTTAQNAERSATMAEQATAAAGASAETQTRIEAGAQDSERGLQLEQERIETITSLCIANSIPDNIRDQWISGGTGLRLVGDQMVKIMQARGKTNPQSVSNLGLSERETQRFSIRKAILAVREGNWSKAGFEATCSQEIATRLNRQPDPNKIYVPLEVQQRAFNNPVEVLAYALMRAHPLVARDLTVATAGAGGFLVGTENVGFIELLRNLSVILRMGATRLGGLQGNITIPKQSAAGTAFWLATEATAITESQPTFVQIALSPKNVGGYTEISRQLLLQSNPSAEALVMADLAAIVALAIDLAGLNGSGASGQPTGILQTAGIGSVTGTSLDYADIIEFLTDTAGGNALFDSSGFATTPPVAGLLKQRVKFASTASPIWEGKLLNGSVDGYNAMASMQMPTATMLFGYFAAVILAEWGVLELEVNPYANFPAGIVGVRAMASVDVGVRYPTAFSAASSIT